MMWRNSEVRWRHLCLTQNQSSTCLRLAGKSRSPVQCYRLILILHQREFVVFKRAVNRNQLRLLEFESYLHTLFYTLNFRKFSLLRLIRFLKFFLNKLSANLSSFLGIH